MLPHIETSNSRSIRSFEFYFLQAGFTSHLEKAFCHPPVNKHQANLSHNRSAGKKYIKTICIEVLYVWIDKLLSMKLKKMKRPPDQLT